MLIDTAYEKALEVLRMNSTRYGFSASVEKHSNYYSIWSRDHSICAIAAVLTGDKELIATAKNGVLQLLRKQIDHGQVPSYIEVENKNAVYGGLGSITSVDSNMWVAIAAAVLYKKTRDRRLISDTNVDRYKRLYGLMKAFDSNNCGLIEVPKAGDWADIFNRTYHVLYDECLYYEALKSLQYLFACKTKTCLPSKNAKKRIIWIRKRRARTKKRINSVFWLTKENIPDVIEEYMIYGGIEEKEYGYYQSHLMPFKLHWQKRIDTFGNILSIATGIANTSKANKIIKYIAMNKINQPFPLRALSPPVFPKDRGWEPIYKIREQPHTYHNGGIWPVIAGFWIYSLAKKHKHKQAKTDLKNLAIHLEKNNWEFNEYYHGKSFKAMGRKFQAWSAAGYILGYNSVMSRINVFDY